MKLERFKPALFLDRDGVINVDHGYVSKIENFVFIDGIFEICRYFKRLEYKIIVITNQSGIGRGFFSQESFEKLSKWMSERFIQEGCSIDLILAATANPDDGEVSAAELFRRKPNPGMIFEAEDYLKLDLSRSILIGDTPRDVEAGRAAGIPNLYLIGNHSDQTQTSLRHRKTHPLPKLYLKKDHY